ncbi:Uncharacterised protein [Shigella sonnei]|nr:Uncharacterised protein [Shigella sonnei]
MPPDTFSDTHRTLSGGLHYRRCLIVLVAGNQRRAPSCDAVTFFQFIGQRFQVTSPANRLHDQCFHLGEMLLRDGANEVHILRDAGLKCGIHLRCHTERNRKPGITERSVQ